MGGSNKKNKRKKSVNSPELNSLSVILPIHVCIVIICHTNDELYMLKL